MIIDFHTHCYPDLLAKKALGNVPKDSPFGAFYDGTLPGLVDYIRRCGVERAVTLHIATRPDYVRSVNDWAAVCQSTENIYAFGTIHPEFKDYKEEIKRLKAQGIRGLKFHPYYQQFDVDDRRVYRIYEAAAGEGMIMLFHTGVDSRNAGDYCSPKKFHRFVCDFKGAMIVGAHLGGMFWWQEAFDLLLGKDIYLDTSCAFRFLSEEEKVRLLKEHDNKRILFGSDTPWVDIADDIKALESYLTKENKDDIFYNNAMELLKPICNDLIK